MQDLSGTYLVLHDSSPSILFPQSELEDQYFSRRIQESL